MQDQVSDTQPRDAVKISLDLLRWSTLLKLVFVIFVVISIAWIYGNVSSVKSGLDGLLDFGTRCKARLLYGDDGQMVFNETVMLRFPIPSEPGISSFNEGVDKFNKWLNENYGGWTRSQGEFSFFRKDSENQRGPCWTYLIFVQGKSDGPASEKIEKQLATMVPASLPLISVSIPNPIRKPKDGTN